MPIKKNALLMKKAVAGALVINRVSSLMKIRRNQNSG